MPIQADITGRSRVAVGPTRTAAAEIYASTFDDIFLTSYDDFDAEVGPDRAEIVALTDGDALPTLLPALADGSTQRILVQVPDDAQRLDWFSDFLVQRRDLGISNVTHVRGRVILTLDRDDRDGELVRGPGVRELLSSIGDSTAPLDKSEEVWPTRRPAKTGSVKSSRTRPPAQRGSTRFGLIGRRHLFLLTLSGVLLACVVLVLVLIGRSGLGANGVIIALIAGLVLIQAVTLAAVLFLFITVRRGHSSDAEFRSTLLRRTGKVLRQGASARYRGERHGKRLAAIQESEAKRVATHRYVVELGRQQIRLADQAREEARQLHNDTQRLLQTMLSLQQQVSEGEARPFED